MQKTPYVFPIVGGRKIEHLYKNIQALDVAVSDEHIKKIESAVPFVKGSPYDLFVRTSPINSESRQHQHHAMVILLTRLCQRPNGCILRLTFFRNSSFVYHVAPR